MSDELAERLPPLYERNIRRAAQGEQLYDLPASLQPLLAEFDRLLAVEKAAAALSEFWRVSPTVQDMSLDEMHELDQLLNDLWREMGSKP